MWHRYTGDDDAFRLRWVGDEHDVVVQGSFNRYLQTLHDSLRARLDFIRGEVIFPAWSGAPFSSATIVWVWGIGIFCEASS